MNAEPAPRTWRLARFIGRNPVRRMPYDVHLKACWLVDPQRCADYPRRPAIVEHRFGELAPNNRTPGDPPASVARLVSRPSWKSTMGTRWRKTGIRIPPSCEEWTSASRTAKEL